MKSATVVLSSPAMSGGNLPARLLQRLATLAADPCVARILVLRDETGDETFELSSKTVSLIEAGTLFSGRTVERVLDATTTDAILFMLDRSDIEFEPHGLQHLLDVADATGAGIAYANFREVNGGEIVERTTTAYQLGSVRENFDFGALLLVSTEAARTALETHGRVSPSLRWAGLYDLRLKLSIDSHVVHIPQSLYVRKKGSSPSLAQASDNQEEIHDRTHADEHAYQLEIEEVLTAHLRRLGAYLEPVFSPIPAPEDEFPVTASVIIPVRNREGTIADAVRSALAQKTSFEFNVIVIDDHSTDATTEILEQLTRQHDRVIHRTPRRADLGIGGLWNEAVYSPQCGMFAVQLDSDDVYSTPTALEKLINKFWEPPTENRPAENCSAENGLAAPRYAMVTGSFTTVNFDLEEVEPGLCDHRELTPENGRNNALRVDGLGAPRAFYVPLLRRFGFPNASYGEDYAVGLRLSREYEIGRIFEPLYLARQWEGNTIRSMPLGSVKSVNLKELLPRALAANPELLLRLRPLLVPLMIASKNSYAVYKDWLRTVEIQARIKQNKRRVEMGSNSQS